MLFAEVVTVDPAPLTASDEGSTSGPNSPSREAALYGTMMTARSAWTQTALDALRAALERVAVAVTIHPGRCMLLNHQFMFHGPHAFEASFDADVRASKAHKRDVVLRPVDLMDVDTVSASIAVRPSTISTVDMAIDWNSN